MNYKIIISFFSLIIATYTFGQQATMSSSSDSINQTIEGKKEGKWVVTADMSTKAYGYKSDQVYEEGEYKNNRKQGVWIKYYPNGNKMSEITYRNGRPNGPFKLYYDNGQIEEESNWVNRVYNGEFKRYYPDGTLEQEKYFAENGKASGKVVYYYPNGKKELEFTTYDGKETGEAVRYYANGDVKEIISFNDGKALAFEDKKLVNKDVKIKDNSVPNKYSPKAQGEVNEATSDVTDGYSKRFNENNDIIMDGEFKGGKLWNGKWYKYDKNGLLLKIEVYKDGKYAGDGVLGN